MTNADWEVEIGKEEEGMEKIEICPHCGGDLKPVITEITEFFANETKDFADEAVKILYDPDSKVGLK